MTYKICILIERLNGGGAERSAGLLSIILSELGHNVALITLFDDIAYPYKGELINLGAYKNGSTSSLNKYYRYKQLYREIKEHQFDIVLDFRMKNFPLRELILNKIVFRTNMINMVRHFNLKWYFPNPILLSKYLYKGYLSINTVSKTIQKEIEKKFSFSNVSSIYSPVDISYIKNKAQQENTITDDYVIALGRLNVIKQFDKLLEAYKISVLPLQNIKLYIVGSGPERKALLTKIKRLNLQDKVHLLPFQNNPFPYLAGAKFLIMSSLGEGFPRVLIESLACETPIISFDCKSGPNEIIIDRKNGLLVENQNFEALTNAINEMYTDNTLYEICKANALDSIQSFSMNQTSVKWDKYITELMESRF
ncbi:glycosyltransferase [uncultured Winogradskyella sp.]|uniref:glycosyltransferase n=1 Tax=uncultured Winogradskyella sp. TaxID=395353 RepID=UPI002639B644|nr:glycosyltransferase [uncultured Winogradskyella sp.]